MFTKIKTSIKGLENRIEEIPQRIRLKDKKYETKIFDIEDHSRRSNS